MNAEELLDNEAANNNVDFFKTIIELGLKPTFRAVSIAATCNAIDVFKICVLDCSISDIEYHMDNAASRGYIEIFDICLQNGGKPRIRTIQDAARSRNLYIFNKCIEHGIVPDELTKEIISKSK